MNLFDQLVERALINQPELSHLRPVVEKELLHHDILKILSKSGFLNALTFIGGTALRSCYGNVRLSEDLDFTGGSDFSRADFRDMGKTLVDGLHHKYGFKVVVRDSKCDIKNVDTWKIQVETRPVSKHLPMQRIHIDVCALPSYDLHHMLLLNPYGVDMGTQGLVVPVQSQEEIYTDKLLAFALRPNRIKHRDLWDIVWLHGKKITPNLTWISLKLADRSLSEDYFRECFHKRVALLQNDQNIQRDFVKEMHRFLPPSMLHEHVDQSGFWSFLVHLLGEFDQAIK